MHHDGRWTHEGHPILNRKLREAFDRGVAYAPDEDVFVVTLGHYRGQIEVEEAAFFVRSIDLERGTVTLSDGSEEALDPGTLGLSERDGALLASVARPGTDRRVLARFDAGAHAELLLAVEPTGEGFEIALGGRRYSLPDALTREASESPSGRL